MIVTGEPVQWSDIDCGGISASGTYGNTLGCIASTVAWVMYSIYLQGGPVATTPVRSIAPSNHQFQVHSEWEGVENCTTQCLLVANTPENTWTAVGNGTYNGIFHELHFMHNRNFTTHRVYQGQRPSESSLSACQYYATTFSNGRYVHTEFTPEGTGLKLIGMHLVERPTHCKLRSGLESL